ncbi:MAG: cobyrinic acid a,c-diamide synthase [Rhodospirillales bacterium RIFCSPLOWO2_12_FULL_58_28]|nr:MAG: cobyrinic acid a,c-diamide synthase [Rhodospirillales bacterium RIFCSPLOWO2_02_FULL_58_16]OHC77633.1 MAG: cobyrinic acid a,c-diamide synthase [Rhodospirillales bacterium RIFCSPLOWO2_12_FULL_58_28]
MTPDPLIAPNLAARTKGRNIFAVASGKGGVGKTWFSITLAHTLASKNVRVLLFDGDLGLANLDIQLGLMPKHDLGSVVTGRLTLNQAVVHYDEGNFDVIAGRSGSGGLANIASGRLQILGDDLALLAAGYDKVIMDLGAGVERTVRQLTHGVNSCLVLATNEPTSLTDAYAFIKITHMERPDTKIKIVINMVNSIREGERTYNTLLKACEGFLKISPPLLGIIRRDNKVADAIRNQVSILTRSPNAEAVEDVEKIAVKMIRSD